jgi:hypothetical protein
MLKQGSTTRSSYFWNSCEDNESVWLGISWRSKYSVNIELTCGITLFIPLFDCEINFLMTFGVAFVTLTIVVSSVI